MRRLPLVLIIIPAGFTLLVCWFSWQAFQSAPAIASENLRGAALAIAAAIEQLAGADHDFTLLSRYSSRDIAYFSLTDRQGILRYHTNRSLIGTTAQDAAAESDRAAIREGRKKLGTGEEIYLMQTAIHPGSGDYFLTLALHTYRADTVLRRAKAGVSIVLFLTASLWLVTVGVLFLLRRDTLRSQEMLRHEELARLGEMGAVMAHEIRNPLAGIKGFAQLVESATNLQEAHRCAEKIITQSLRMEGLVNDLLSLTRQDQGERELVDCTLLVQECVSLIRMEADPERINITVTADEQIQIMALPDRLRQLLFNLLKNGLQAMPDGGLLSVRLASAGQRATLSVSDSGIGIPPDHLPHIFEPFWTSKPKGTGLGLALCRKIAAEHGGRLTVASKPGVGTTFTLILPLSR